ncbi:MFS transporter [Sphingomonas sp. MMS24-J13]|uniref:MFS transporter n=1 Tax=Sphingomonas sp. MMS24-J13 TaxID=3238686 RepID=UPI00384AC349
MARPSRGYEIGLLILLTFANGVVGLDRLTASFLSPYIVADLKLTNTQLGLLGASLSLAIAVSAFLLGRVADRTGKRKTILVACTIVFSVGSALGGFASGFLFLFLARFALGLAEGPMVPVGQAMMADASAPARRGLNMGLMQMVGAFLLGAMIGPILATHIADAYGWRAAFFLSGVPGLLLALGLALYVRDTPKPAAREDRLPLLATIATLLRIRNMRIAIALAAVYSAWVMVQNVFLPVYLTQAKGLSSTTMGWVLGMCGLAGMAGGILLPGLSDRIGRRPVCAITCFASIGTPIALLLIPAGSAVPLALAILIGWIPIGIAPLYCAVIPSESVPPAMVTSAIGLAMGTDELLGGVVAPFAAGNAADAFGLAAPLWLCLGFAIIAGLLALMLEETAPMLRRDR